MKDPVIVLTGRKFSGKDTLVDGVFSFKTTKLSFGGQLKKKTVQVFPWMNLDYPSELKDQPILPNGMSPRSVWEFMDSLKNIDENIYVDMVVNEYETWHRPNRVVFITDLRYEPELRMIKQRGWPIVRIIDGTSREHITEDAREDYIDTIDADYEFINHKTSQCVLDFDRLVKHIIENSP